MGEQGLKPFDAQKNDLKCDIYKPRRGCILVAAGEAEKINLKDNMNYQPEILSD
jgi:hypothetical protein